MLSGEWHNNHHLFPGSARAGFLPYQLDLAWIYIYSLFKLGMVSNYKDSKKEFLSQYYAIRAQQVFLTWNIRSWQSKKFENACL